jgi:hypothetical protein
MSAWLAVLPVVLFGWGLTRLAAPSAGLAETICGSVVWGALGQTTWMATLDLTGVRWSPSFLLLAGPAVAISALAARRFPGQAVGPARPAAAAGAWRWAGLAAVVALAHAALIAARPAVGWDFRYIWGLKAQVFAMNGTHDAAWLAWPPHAFAHPTYPPLWCDLLASGVAAGAGPAAVASAWQALVAIALGAGCWACTRGAASPVRALAAAAGAWSPVIFWPRYSGYAEPLLALLVVAAFCGLDRLTAGEQDVMPALVASTAALALVKDEGSALALGVALAAVRIVGGRRALPVVGAFAVPWVCWHLFLLHGGIHQETYRLSLPLIVRHLGEAPVALAAALKPKLVVLAAAEALAAPGLRGPRLRGVRLALTVWGLAVAGAYLTTTSGLAWHLFTSLDRVIAAPLPAIVALAVRAGWGARQASGGLHKAPSGCDFALDRAGADH